MDELTESTFEQQNFSREDFGLLMRELREKAGFTIEEVSVATRISYNYIEALESGKFEELPGVVFVKGFVKNLVKTYSVTGIDVISKLDLVYKQKELEHFESPIANESKQFFIAKKKEYRGKSIASRVQNFVLKNRKKIAYSVSAVLVTTVALSFFIRKYYVEKNTVKVTKTEKVHKKLAAKKAAKVGIAKTVPVARPKTFNDSSVKLVVLESTKVKISKDFGGWERVTLKPQEYKYDFDSNIRFVFSDAGAVNLNYNGQEIKKLGEKGQRKRISFRKNMPFGEKKNKL